MTSPLRSMVRVAAVGVHLTVASLLVLMVIPSFRNIAEQIRSGYTPPGYWVFPLLIAVAIGSGAAIVVGLARWVRGSRRTLVFVDIAVLVMSWSVLLIFVFSNDLPIVNVVLSPVALVLAWCSPPWDPRLGA